MAEYPLDHRRGFAPVPRDAAAFEPLMRDRSGVLLRVWFLIYARCRHEPGWVRASHGNVQLGPGQCVIGVREVAEELDIGKNTAQRALAELERLGLIARNAGQRGSVVSVPNYGSFGESEQRQRDSRGDTLGDSYGDTLGDSRGDSIRDTGGDGGGDTSGPLSNGRTEERGNGEDVARPLSRVELLWAFYEQRCRENGIKPKLFTPGDDMPIRRLFEGRNPWSVEQVELGVAAAVSRAAAHESERFGADGKRTWHPEVLREALARQQSNAPARGAELVRAGLRPVRDPAREIGDLAARLEAAGE